MAYRPKRVLSADIENWAIADTKSEPTGSDGGPVAGRISGGSWLLFATVISGGEAIDSGEIPLDMGPANLATV